MRHLKQLQLPRFLNTISISREGVEEPANFGPKPKLSAQETIETSPIEVGLDAGDGELTREIFD